MQKLLTIVIPAYNMEAYLSRCVSSLLTLANAELQQTEIIIVNDGSTDGTLAIAQKFQSQWPEIVRVIDKENGNYGSCVNCGLASAQGRYIKILDADDSFAPEAYQQFVSRLQTADVDLIVTEFYKVDGDGNELETSHFCDGDNGQIHTTLDTFRPLLQMHALCYRTEMLREHGYEQTTGISYTDTEWVILPMLYVRRFVCWPMPLYRYLIGREGQTMDATILFRKHEQLITTLAKCIQWINSERRHGHSSHYVEARLCYTISFLYYTILVDNGAWECPALIDFDQYLYREAPYAYHHLENSILADGSQFHFVQAWRQNHYHAPQMPLSSRVRAFVHRCKVHLQWRWSKLFSL